MKFPQKLWQIVNECVSGAISWGTNGESIVIDMCKFEREFLSENNSVFKTKNFFSFVRQLNLYGFRKCRRNNDVHEFKSAFFIRERKDLLKFLKRNLKCNFGTSLSAKKFKFKMAETRVNTQSSGEKEKSPHDAATPTSVENIRSVNSGLENGNSFSSAWWGNPYLSNCMYPMNKQSVNDSSALAGVKLEEGNAAQKTDDASPSSNKSVYRNVVFVPVPAYYGIYPGYLSGNMAQPFPLPSNEETMNNTI